MIDDFRMIMIDNNEMNEIVKTLLIFPFEKKTTKKLNYSQTKEEKSSSEKLFDNEEERSRNNSFSVGFCKSD